MYQLVFIAIGGSVGAVARYLVSKGVYMLSLGIFPYGTLAVNTIGAFLIGFLFSLFNNVVIPVHYKSMITVGFLGAFTTFSTYSLESVNLLMGGEYKIAGLNILLNNFLSLVAVMGGIFLFRLIQPQGA
ncbi:MAG: fluoride efflux transporter CrcB [Spirochaetia bacterium]|jgi:CrcB protein|nr:fluoride efflux transporter CrcB [Spirochaetia bacterium]